MDATTVRTWMSAIAASVSEQRDYLVQLDAAIGDGDHGINMTRGFTAVVRALEAESDATPGKLLILGGKTLVSSVGGASGPLWGTALRRAGRALGDDPTFDAAQLSAALDAALAGVVELGAANLGDKTMVDALTPAAATLRQRVNAGDSIQAAVHAAADSAEQGKLATEPMQARKGRASYLGERSVGHIDPGAASSVLVMRALEHAVATEG